MRHAAPPHHRPLAVLIALALCTSLSLPAYAVNAVAEAVDCDIDPDHSVCEAQDEATSSTTPWLIGGVALAGAAAAAAGGGGGGGGSDGGGDGGGVPPGSEGGQYGGNQFLAGPGSEISWDRNVETRVTGAARNEGSLRINAGTLSVRNDGHLRNTGTLRIGQAASLVV